MKTATMIERYSSGQALYRVSPPITSDDDKEHEFVFCSAVRSYREETMIFPCNEKGEAIDYSPIAMVKHLSHEDAFAQVGYQINQGAEK